MDGPTPLQLLEQHGQTIADWAARSGLNPGNVWRIAHGRTGGNSSTLLKLLSSTHVGPLPMLRALVRARESYLEQRKVMKVVDSRARGYATRG